jgi:RNA polymerase sigma factor (sigma-70 family)
VDSFSLFTENRLISRAAQHIDEPVLVSRLKAKDRSALEYLYDHYSGALYGVIFRIVRKEEIAEEVLQDVFLKIWERFDHYDATKGKLFTWLLNVARNQAIDKTRSKEISKGQKTGRIDNLVNRIDRAEYVEQSIESIGLKEVLNSLPEEQKFVVDHLYLKGYSQSELAEEYNIPLGTVKTRLRLAMIQLRSTLGVT